MPTPCFKLGTRLGWPRVACQSPKNAANHSAATKIYKLRRSNEKRKKRENRKWSKTVPDPFRINRRTSDKHLSPRIVFHRVFYIYSMAQKSGVRTSATPCSVYRTTIPYRAAPGHAHWLSQLINYVVRIRVSESYKCQMIALFGCLCVLRPAYTYIEYTYRPVWLLPKTKKNEKVKLYDAISFLSLLRWLQFCEREKFSLLFAAPAVDPAVAVVKTMANRIGLARRWWKIYM